MDIEVKLIAVLVSIKKELLSAKIFLKEVCLSEYYRRESIRSFSRQVNNNAGNILLTSIYDE